jgi:hypothetical protein
MPLTSLAFVKECGSRDPVGMFLVHISFEAGVESAIGAVSLCADCAGVLLS